VPVDSLASHLLLMFYDVEWSGLQLPGGCARRW